MIKNKRLIIEDTNKHFLIGSSRQNYWNENKQVLNKKITNENKPDGTSLQISVSNVSKIKFSNNLYMYAYW